jgi:hypothetical protein
MAPLGFEQSQDLQIGLSGQISSETIGADSTLEGIRMNLQIWKKNRFLGRS